MREITDSQCKRSRRDATGVDRRFGRTVRASVFWLSKSFLTLDVKVLNRIKFDIACTRLGGC